MAKIEKNIYFFQFLCQHNNRRNRFLAVLLFGNAT